MVESIDHLGGEPIASVIVGVLHTLMLTAKLLRSDSMAPFVTFSRCLLGSIVVDELYSLS